MNGYVGGSEAPWTDYGNDTGNKQDCDLEQRTMHMQLWQDTQEPKRYENSPDEDGLCFSDESDTTRRRHTGETEKVVHESNI